MQVTKEKIPSSLPNLKMSDAKNASFFGLECNAADMMGLSWIVLDYQPLHLAQSERRCNVTG